MNFSISFEAFQMILSARSLEFYEEDISDKISIWTANQSELKFQRTLWF